MTDNKKVYQIYRYIYSRPAFFGSLKKMHEALNEALETKDVIKWDKRIFCCPKCYMINVTNLTDDILEIKLHMNKRYRNNWYVFNEMERDEDDIYEEIMLDDIKLVVDKAVYCKIIMLKNIINGSVNTDVDELPFCRAKEIYNNPYVDWNGDWFLKLVHCMFYGGIENLNIEELYINHCTDTDCSCQSNCGPYHRNVFDEYWDYYRDWEEYELRVKEFSEYKKLYHDRILRDVHNLFN